jgi:signal transduction histidine kinase
VRQLLTNILQNAIQHGTPEAPVTVSLSGSLRHVILMVHNTGAPIHEDELERIFDPLVMGPETPSPHVSTHMGLGLYIARQIVEAHGGTIVAESAEAAGTTFTVNLPVIRSERF